MADSSKDIQLRELKDMINDLRKMIKTLQATVDATNKREEALTQERDNLAYSARTAHPFQRNGAPFRFKLSKAQQVD